MISAVDDRYRDCSEEADLQEVRKDHECPSLRLRMGVCTLGEKQIQKQNIET